MCMKKTIKNILIYLLIWAIFINPFSVVYAGEETDMPYGSDTSMEIEAEGTDSVGDFLASEIQTQKEEQAQNNGNCIISLEFDDEEDTYAEIMVDIKEMPAYFTATAYLLDSATKKLECKMECV